MKKIIFLLTIFAGLVFFQGCEPELTDPKLDMSQTVKPSILFPQDGTDLVFTSEMADENLVFQWTEAQYNVANLEDTKYVLEMGLAGMNFQGAVTVYNGIGTSYTTTVGASNNGMLALGLEPGVAYGFEFRVRSYLNDLSDYTQTYSDAVAVTVTPYADLITIKPIYLLGDATPVGWDNTQALPMAHVGDGRFARVETLDPAGDWFKFIAFLGLWAPQWGTDATGTSALGPLVYRPDEATPDPAAIPGPDVLGDYYIEADTALLTYKTFLTSGELYLVGSATTVGWDNTQALPFTEVEPHIFEITVPLVAGGMKFLEVVGAWAPQWGTNDKATAAGGPLIYRPSESVPDPAEVPSPGSGQYKIRVDLTTISYTIEAQ